MEGTIDDQGAGVDNRRIEAPFIGEPESTHQTVWATHSRSLPVQYPELRINKADESILWHGRPTISSRRTPPGQHRRNGATLASLSPSPPRIDPYSQALLLQPLQTDVRAASVSTTLCGSLKSPSHPARFRFPRTLGLNRSAHQGRISPQPNAFKTDSSSSRSRVKLIAPKACRPVQGFSWYHIAAQHSAAAPMELPGVPRRASHAGWGAAQADAVCLGLTQRRNSAGQVHDNSAESNLVDATITDSGSKLHTTSADPKAEAHTPPVLKVHAGRVAREGGALGGVYPDGGARGVYGWLPWKAHLDRRTDQWCTQHSNTAPNNQSVGLGLNCRSADAIACRKTISEGPKPLAQGGLRVLKSKLVNTTSQENSQVKTENRDMNSKELQKSPGFVKQQDKDSDTNRGITITRINQN